MAEKKAKLPIYQTPVGVAKYPNIVKPRAKYQREDDFKKGVIGSGEYSLKLVLSGADAASLAEKIDAAAQAALEQARKDAKNPKEAKEFKLATPSYKAEVDDDGEETGNTSFNFKLPSTIKSKSGDAIKLRPAIFDAKGKPLTGQNLNVGGGSKVKVAFEMRPFAIKGPVGAGVSLQLKAVQIIDLVEWNGEKDASGYGFGEEEGFDASAMPLDTETTEAPERTDAEAASADGEGDF